MNGIVLLCRCVSLAFQDESQQKVRELEEFIKKQEVDTDIEIYDIRMKYEQNLKEEKKANATLKVELDTTTKSRKRLQTEIENGNLEIETLNQEEQELQSRIKSLENDITELKATIQNKDGIMQDKSTTVNDSQRQSQSNIMSANFPLELESLAEDAQPLRRRTSEPTNPRFQDESQQKVRELEEFIKKQEVDTDIEIYDIHMKYEQNLKEEKKANATLKVELDTTTKSRKRLQTEIENGNLEIETLNQEEQELQSRIKSLENDITELKATIQNKDGIMQDKSTTVNDSQRQSQSNIMSANFPLELESLAEDAQPLRRRTSEPTNPRFQDESQQKVRELEEFIKKQEVDTDIEIYDIRMQYEQNLKEEKKANATLKVELDTTTKSRKRLQTEIENGNLEIETLNQEEQELQSRIKSLENDITELKATIQNKDGIMQDKSTTVNDSQRQSQSNIMSANFPLELESLAEDAQPLRRRTSEPTNPRFQDESQQKVRELEEFIKKQEVDTDIEIYDIRMKYEQNLKEEKKANATLKVELDTTTKSRKRLQTEIENGNLEIETLNQEEQELQSRIKSLENDITELKATIQNKDGIMQDKSTTVNDSQRQSQSNIMSANFPLELESLAEDAQPLRRRTSEPTNPRFQDESQQKVRELEEFIKKQEVDTDIEIYDIRMKYEQNLKEEKKANATLKVELDTTTKSRKRLQTEIENGNLEIETLNQEEQELQSRIKSLENDITELKATIQNKDGIMQDKSTTVNDSQRQSQSNIMSANFPLELESLAEDAQPLRRRTSEPTNPRFQDESQQKVRELEEFIKKQEVDTDIEIYDIRMKYEQNLKEEKKANATLKVELDTTTKSRKRLQTEIENGNLEIETLNQEEQELQSRIKSLENDITELKATIQNKDGIMQDKSTTVNDSQRQSQSNIMSANFPLELESLAEDAQPLRRRTSEPTNPRFQDESQQKVRELEEFIKKQEVDTDIEIYDIRMKYEQNLKEEKKANATLKVELDTTTKSRKRLQTEIENGNLEIETLNQEEQELQSRIKSLENDITELKATIQNKDGIMQDKEQ
ncbi:unnamed protein product [Leuciscus chuanchicus]